MKRHDPAFYLNLIAQTIFDRKGFNILALDVKEISSLTDYIVIAEGSVDRHVRAIAHAIIEQLEQSGLNPARVEGIGEGDWIVIDYVHIMVHLFKPGLRDRYQLEQLLREGKIVDLQIDVSVK